MLRFASSIALVCLSVPTSAFLTAGNAGLSLRSSPVSLRGSNQFTSASSQRSSTRLFMFHSHECLMQSHITDFCL